MRAISLSIETIVVISVLLVAMISIILFFTGSSATEFGKIGTFSEEATGGADTVAGGVAESTTRDYFQSSRGYGGSGGGFPVD